MVGCDKQQEGERNYNWAGASDKQQHAAALARLAREPAQVQRHATEHADQNRPPLQAAQTQQEEVDCWEAEDARREAM